MGERLRAGTPQPPKERPPPGRPSDADGGEQDEDNTRIWIGGLPDEIDEEEIREEFQRFGNIKDVRIKTKATGNTFAFVRFDHIGAAEEAQSANQSEAFGMPFIKVAWSSSSSSRAGADDGRPKPPSTLPHGKFRVTVSNLPDDMGWQQLKELGTDFAEAGKCTFARTHQDGTGVLEFQSAHDMKTAIQELDGTILPGTKRRISACQEKEKHGEGPDRGHRSRSPHRNAKTPQWNPSEVQGKFRLRIENLPEDMGWQELKELGTGYAKIGQCTFSRTNRDRTGVLEFTSEPDMKQAIRDLDGKFLSGSQTAVVAYREDRQPARASQVEVPHHSEDRWECESCGFKNVPKNEICGGGGKLGCKEPRPSNDDDDDDARVWVGGLPDGIEEDEIVSEYEKFGKISRVRVCSQRSPPFAFVHFQKLESAEEAVQTTNQQPLFGMPFVKVALKGEAPVKERARSRSPPPNKESDRWNPSEVQGKFRVRIENLPDDMQWQELKELGSGYAKEGQCTFSRTNRDRTGVLEFTSEADMLRAIRDLNGKFLSGSSTAVVAHPEGERSERKSQGEASRATASSAGASQRKEGSERWKCEGCGFENVPSNDVCGGLHGKLGCKEPRPPDDDARIWIGGLPDGILEEDIKDEFKGFGTVSTVKVCTKGKVPFAFVQFVRSKCAERAVESSNQQPMFGMPFVKVQLQGEASANDRRQRSRSPPPPPNSATQQQGEKLQGEYRVLIENLPEDMHWQVLKDLGNSYATAGQCTFSRTNKDRSGVLEFTAEKDMKHAIRQIDGQFLSGSRTRVIAYQEDKRPTGPTHTSHGESSRRNETGVRWECGCGFKNVEQNDVCGGINGKLGCKEPRPPEDDARIWIGGLPEGIQEDEIKDEYKGFGTIVSVQICFNAKPPFAFVQFVRCKAAEEAVHSTNQQPLFGMQFVKVALKREGASAKDRGHRSRSPPNRNNSSQLKGEYRVCIENLPEGMPWQDLKDLGNDHSKAGQCTFSRTNRDRTGVLEFTAEPDMKRAIRALDGGFLSGSKTAVIAYQENQKPARTSYAEGSGRNEGGAGRNDGGERWECEICGFKNVDKNDICGGGGRLGCKEPRPSEDGARVWIGGLPENIQEDEIKEEFKRFGTISGVQLRAGSEGKPPFAFLDFVKKRCAEQAAQATNQQPLFGRQWIKVVLKGAEGGSSGGKDRGKGNREEVARERRGGQQGQQHAARSRSPRRQQRPDEGKFRIVVDNLPEDMCWKELKNLGSKFASNGECTFARTNPDRSGVLEFSSAGDMKRAIEELDGRRFEGSNNRVTARQER